MRQLHLLGSLLAIALPLAAPAFAAPSTSGAKTAAPAPAAISLSRLSCPQLRAIITELANARKTGDHKLEMEAEGFLTFLLGYASGHRGDAVITRDVDEQIGTQIEGFCKANPQASFLDAVRALP